MSTIRLVWGRKGHNKCFKMDTNSSPKLSDVSFSFLCSFLYGSASFLEAVAVITVMMEIMKLFEKGWRSE